MAFKRKAPKRTEDTPELPAQEPTIAQDVNPSEPLLPQVQEASAATAPEIAVPEPTPEPAPTATPSPKTALAYRVSSKRSCGFWAAGRHFTPQPVDVFLDVLTELQAREIESQSRWLSVELVEIVDPR